MPRNLAQDALQHGEWSGIVPPLEKVDLEVPETVTKRVMAAEEVTEPLGTFPKFR